MKKDRIIQTIFRFLSIILLSLSLVLLLLDVVNIFGIQLPYSIYLIVLPISIVGFLKLWIIKRSGTEMIRILCTGCWLSAIEFLCLLWREHLLFNTKIEIWVYMSTIICVLLFDKYKTEKDKIKLEDKANESVPQSNKKIFSLFYVNTDKVYEISMLLNNRIITSVTEENVTENLMDEQTKTGMNANIDYLRLIKGELNLSKNIQVQNSVKSKVLENFDVKTTKSNMLADIIEKSKLVEKDTKIEMGDLICLRDAELELLNANDTYAITKLLLNGAFNDTKISSNAQDMKVEMNLASIINSLLKDCVYEMDCKGASKEFLLTIPMTFENDFENSYNIYDLQVGKVTVVGIYRGKESHRGRLSLQEIFSESSKIVGKQNDADDFQLKSSTQHESDSKKEERKSLEVIDVIAIIQEINAK